MAKKWYPVIDITTCIECGVCSDFCQHDVYDKSKAPTPKVISPENCIDHCHGCGNQCPAGAISYVEDDTDWIPPALRAKNGTADIPKMSDCCCCGEKIDGVRCIKVLGTGCKNCHAFYENAQEAVKTAGLNVEVEYITDLQKVMEYGVMSMPALVVNEQVVSMGKVLKAADIEKLFK